LPLNRRLLSPASLAWPRLKGRSTNSFGTSARLPTRAWEPDTLSEGNVGGKQGASAGGWT